MSGTRASSPRRWLTMRALIMAVVVMGAAFAIDRFYNDPESSAENLKIHNQSGKVVKLCELKREDGREIVRFERLLPGDSVSAHLAPAQHDFNFVLTVTFEDDTTTESRATTIGMTHEKLGLELLEYVIRADGIESPPIRARPKQGGR